MHIITPIRAKKRSAPKFDAEKAIFNAANYTVKILTLFKLNI